MGRSFSSKKKIPGSTASVFIVFLFCLTACGPVEENHSPELDRIMVDALAGQGIAGAVLLVARGGDTLHYRAYGHAERYSYDGAGLASPVPMQTGHVFDLASLTKVYATTFALMLLADSGLIRPDDPVTDYLPDYPDDKNGILIRHLLNHTSGLLPWQPVFLFDRNDDPASARAWIAASPLQSTPGEERAYSDLGFMTLGYVVEEVSGQPLDRFLADELYGRLGLNHTGFNPLSAGITPLVSTSHGNPFEIRMIDDDDFGYFVDGSSAQMNTWREYVLKGEVSDGNAWYAHRGVAGHAGLFSTAGDLLKLSRLLLGEDAPEGRPLIGSSTLRTFLEKDAYGNALGWLKAEGTGDEKAIAHSGFTGTSAVLLPARQTVVILLTNRQHGHPDGDYPNMSVLRQSVLETVLQLTGTSAR